MIYPLKIQNSSRKILKKVDFLKTFFIEHSIVIQSLMDTLFLKLNSFFNEHSVFKIKNK